MSDTRVTDRGIKGLAKGPARRRVWLGGRGGRNNAHWGPQDRHSRHRGRFIMWITRAIAALRRQPSQVEILPPPRPGLTSREGCGRNEAHRSNFLG
jgi:hypothetical protein